MKLHHLIAATMLVSCTAGCNEDSKQTTCDPIPDAGPAASPDATIPLPDPPCTFAGATEVEISTAKLYVEFNSTDADLGVHGAFDDDGWEELCVYDPSGALVLVLEPQNQLQDLTMASIFFESREPPTDEFDFPHLEASFAEGRYEVRGLSHDGTILTGAATFSHSVPAPPTITHPPLGEDEEDIADATVPMTDLVVTWEAVTEDVDGEAIDVSGYEVIITREQDDDPHGYSRPTFDVHVLPELNSLSVPVEFLEPDTVYELEILALEESGNQTITVGFFATE